MLCLPEADVKSVDALRESSYLFKLAVCLEALLQDILNGLHIMVCDALHLHVQFYMTGYKGCRHKPTTLASFLCRDSSGLRSALV